MSRRAIAAIAACVLAVVLFVPTAATAAKKKTIGSDLQGTPSPNTGYGCGDDPCVILQATLPGESNPIRAPFKGIIRKWRFRTTAEESDYDVRLRVVREVGPNEFRFLRRSGPQHIGPEPGTYKFRARLRVRRGDFIALELPPDPADINAFYVPHAGAIDYSWFPAPPLGSTVGLEETNTNTEYFYNATVKKKKKRR